MSEPLIIPIELDKEIKRGIAEGQRVLEGFYIDNLPFMLEAWPKGLHNLSIPSVSIQMPNECRDYIAAYDWKAAKEPRYRLVLLIDEAAIVSGIRSYYPRLGSRSPKDFLSDRDGIPHGCTSGEEAVSAFCASERTLEDCMAAKGIGHQPTVWLRQWMPFHPGLEFRCFMEQQKLVGISQYYDNKPRVGDLAAPYILTRIINWFHKRLIPAIHLNSCVFDVHCDPFNDRTTLIEINPLGNLTYPALFRGDSPDNTFRYLTHTEGPKEDRKWTMKKLSL